MGRLVLLILQPSKEASVEMSQLRRRVLPEAFVSEKENLPEEFESCTFWASLWIECSFV